MTDTVPDPLPFARDPRWHKVVVLGFVLGPLLLTGYAIYRLWGSQVSALDLALLVGGWAFVGMGVSLGYHRMLTHRAFEANTPVRAVLLGLGAMGFQSGPADWAATHRRHHANADREGDPHSPLDGLFHSHLAWIFRDRFVRSGTVHRQLMQDPVVAFANRHSTFLAVSGLAIPFAIGGLFTWSWGGAFSGLLWGGIVRVFLTHHITWSVNSIAHSFGTRPFATTDESRNNLLVALFGFGEGWHNNHHAFPRAAFLGLRWWQFDPGRWAIRAMEQIGWVWNVWLPSPADLVRRRASRT